MPVTSSFNLYLNLIYHQTFKASVQAHYITSEFPLCSCLCLSLYLGFVFKISVVIIYPSFLCVYSGEGTTPLLPEVLAYSFSLLHTSWFLVVKILPTSKTYTGDCMAEDKYHQLHIRFSLALSLFSVPPSSYSLLCTSKVLCGNHSHTT